MASLLGSHIPFPCAACGTPMTVPVKELGREGATVTVALDLGPFRAHIAAAHTKPANVPQEAGP